MTKLSKLLVIFTGLSLFLVTVSGASGELRQAGAQGSAPEWQRYKVESEEFSVLFPVAPAMTTFSVGYAVDKKRRERTLAAYADGVVYGVTTYEKKGLSFDELVHKTTQGQKTEPVEVDGVRGRSFSSADERSVWSRRYFATGTHLYQFVAVASHLGDHTADVSKFFSSITFRKNPEGREVSDGPGEQPLTYANGAVPGSVFRSSEVTVRTSVVSKPKPSYTEQARKNQITGTVVLRAVFSSSGAVENITVLGGLPDGLTERALDAARRIRFIPAIKDGRFVSMWMQLEYNFNLY